MTEIAREAARRDDGKFGEQGRSDPGQLNLGTESYVVQQMAGFEIDYDTAAIAAELDEIGWEPMDDPEAEGYQANSDLFWSTVGRHERNV